MSKIAVVVLELLQWRHQKWRIPTDSLSFSASSFNNPSLEFYLSSPMFLNPQQPSTATPTMAEIASRNLSPSNLVTPFPIQESLQINPSFSANLPPFYNPGLSSIYSNQQGGINCYFNGSRKREREGDEVLELSRSINARICSDLQLSMESFIDQNRACSSSCSSFDPDLSHRIQRQQQELDQFLMLQVEKIKVELEQKKRDYWRNVLAVTEEGMHRILKGKDEEIAKMCGKNIALKERLRILVMEGQVWKTLAQNNEATITALRRDLQLAQAREGEGQGDNGQIDDSQSSCGGEISDDRNCRGCRRKERSVLVLPCLHLCLCKDCDPMFESCPLCKSVKRATVQINMS